MREGEREVRATDWGSRRAGCRRSCGRRRQRQRRRRRRRRHRGSAPLRRSSMRRRPWTRCSRYLQPDKSITRQIMAYHSPEGRRRGWGGTRVLESINPHGNAAMTKPLEPRPTRPAILQPIRRDDREFHTFHAALQARDPTSPTSPAPAPPSLRPPPPPTCFHSNERGQSMIMTTAVTCSAQYFIIFPPPPPPPPPPTTHLLSTRPYKYIYI